MNWKITEHKRPKSIQDKKVKALLQEMSEYSYATYASEFDYHFKQLVQEIPATNNFPASLMFKVTQRNLKSVEVWKMTAEGEFNFKMFTIDYIGS